MLESYDDFGRLEYKIYNGAIPEKLINEVVKAHSIFKNSKYAFFRAQGTIGFELPALDACGNQVNSIQNPNLLGFFPGFMDSINSIIHSEYIAKCLKDFTGSNKHIQYQSMLFDKSTGTKLHQDSWYLDTSPPGKLVGVWVALEDITIEAGPFYVYERGPSSVVNIENRDSILLEGEEALQSTWPASEKKVFLARKGDVLIWNSMVMHGADSPVSQTYTRKSITAHFYPMGANVQDAPIRRWYSIYDHKKLRETKSPDIMMAPTVNPIAYSVMCTILYAAKFISKRLSNDRAADSRLSEIRRIE